MRLLSKTKGEKIDVRLGKMRALFTVATRVAFSIGLMMGSVSPTAAQTLRRTPFEDGTGSIGLPPGWRIGSVYRGQVYCVGPNDAGVNLGYTWEILHPGTSVSDPRHPLARTGDIITALREVLYKRGRATLLSVRSAPAPQAFRGVPAFYLLYELERNGRIVTTFGYFTTLTYGGMAPGWGLYSSGVWVPREQFQQTLPTMLQMWNSWRPNGQEPREGSSSALIDGIMRDRQLSNERISREFRRVL